MTEHTATAATASRTSVLLVGDWMTRNPVTVTPSTSVLNARRLLATYGIRHLPVVEGDVLLGVLSDRDLAPADPAVAWALATLRSDLVAGRYRTVSTVMSSPVIVAGEDETVEEASARMVERRVGVLPVVDGRRLVGILSLVDCVRALLASRTHGGEQAPPPAAEHPEGTTP